MSIMVELQEHTKEKFKTVMSEVQGWLCDSNLFQLISALIIASNVLEARESFKKNRHILKKCLSICLNRERGYQDESL